MEENKAIGQLNFPDDFNKLRESLISSYNDLVIKLNDTFLKLEEIDQQKVLLAARNLKPEILELTRLLGILSSINSIGEYETSVIEKKMELFEF